MRSVFASLLLLASLGCADAQPEPPAASPQPVVHHFVLGDSIVGLAVYDASGAQARDRLTLLVPHDDENTAADVGRAFVAAHGGRLVELQTAAGERRVAFALDGASYSFDPNRIFTAAGIAHTLETEAAAPRALTRLFADVLLALYSPSGTVVTLHNNSDGRYSARSYSPDGPYASDAAAVHLASGVDSDDFFFVTERALYDSLAAQGFNVVLQDNTAVTDDGSLSVWAARQGLAYVNVEAEHGHYAEQERMLAALARALAP